MITVHEAKFHSIPVQTRMPFRYGIAVLTQVPHLFLELTVEIDGNVQKGLAADNLPPKWFVKNPNESFAQELDDMVAVISHACISAKALEPKISIFAIWQACYEAQKNWAQTQGHPPLLWQFGVSMVERALFDSFCKAKRINFANALRENSFAIDLGFFYSSLKHFEPSRFLPNKALNTLHVRHTVGLSDPLNDADIADEDVAQDKLPQSLDATLDKYGISYLKLKLAGNSETDFKRLESIAKTLKTKNKDFVFTLDGNEQYGSLAEFKDFWNALLLQKPLSLILKNLLFVEQPFSRSVALNETLKEALLGWDERPAIIIDESDAELDSLATALESGYIGTSHKNCKGIFKSIANAALLSQKRLEQPERSFMMSAEDLTNIGPVALQQDLAVLASLGINHAERNGHHYFKGLSMYSNKIQNELLENHPDLYTPYDDFATLAIKDGKLNLETIINAPFGLSYDLDIMQFPELRETLRPFQNT